MYEALSPYFNVGFFTKDDINLKTFKKIDVIAFPGGLGDSDSFDKILLPTKEIISECLSVGKKYLGVCMGAYWADKFYYNVLQHARTIQYIKRPTSEIKRPFSTTTTVNWLGSNEDMFFYDGCAIVGDESKFTTIARYANNDPMAIIQNNIGLIGCHPESMPTWYDKSYLKTKWHYYKHHKLLIDFTKRLLS
jgi:glutamine amidotransferase-like uncharacterized protein